MRLPLHPALLLAFALLAGGCFALGWDDYKEAPAGSAGSGGAGGAGVAGGGTTTTTTWGPGGGGGGGPDPLPPPPVPIAQKEAAPRFLDLDGEYIYWSNQGESDDLRGIRRLSRATGEVVRLVDTGNRVPWDLVVSGDHVFWGELIENGDCTMYPDQDRIAAVNREGVPAPQVLWSGCGNARGVAVGGDALYWTVDAGDAVMHMHMPPDGAAENVATSQSGALGIVADGTAVFWANSDGHVIRSFDESTGAQADLTATLDPTWMALDVDAVYWINPTTVSKAPRGMAGTPPTILAQGYADLQGIAVDEKFVYVTEAAAGQVLRMRKDGSAAPVVIAEGQDGPTDITVDSEALYWTNTKGGQIMRQDRP